MCICSVRRNEIYSSNPSSREQSPSSRVTTAEAEAKLQAHFAALYNGFSVASEGQPDTKQSLHLGERIITSGGAVEGGQTPETQITQAEGDICADNSDIARQDEPDNQVYDFRLFSAAAKDGHTKSSLAPQKIILEAEHDHVSLLGETIIHGDGGFLREGKDPRIWTRPRASGQRLAQIQFSTISGENVLQESKRRNWGLEVPWRVKIVKQKFVSGNGLGDISTSIAAVEECKKRKKPGKKRRMVLRMRVKKLEEERSRQEEETKQREEADKQRRMQKNREKKIKQKKRAKAKAEASKQNDVTTGGQRKPICVCHISAECFATETMVKGSFPATVMSGHWQGWGRT